MEANRALKTPDQGIRGRLEGSVLRESETLSMLRGAMNRLRGQTPEPVSTTGSPAKDIPVLDHIGSLENIQSEVQRLVQELVNLV